MIVLQASHIAKQFDGTDVLFDATLVVQTGDRIALIGHNGAGKSTLLRILTGETTCDTGSVHIAKGAQMGYVSQFMEADMFTTVYEYVAQVFEHVRKMEQQLRFLENEMANPDVYNHPQKFEEITLQYTRLQQQFEEMDGYATDARIRRVLDGMQFPPEMQTLHVSNLSGGQKTRLSLARLLAWQPDILVLDEPTNYLDTDTLTWLEDFLKTYRGSLIVVSHDRYFLDSVATGIVELEAGHTKMYSGNYSSYIEQKSAQYEADVKRYEAEQQMISKLTEFVQKNLVRASTTKRAQSRRRWLERIDRMEKPSSKVHKMALSFQCGRASGKDVLRAAQLGIGYPDKRLADDINLYVARGQRIAILGPNGIGKTTLISTLMGNQKPLAGTATWGQHVDIGYYDQEQTDLDMTKTVINQVWDEHPALDTTTIRTALGRFLFRGEDVEKPVQGLSGGERSRLNLCRLMLKAANVLILDEPTNHLDLLAKEVLEDALEEYEGSILFVSHDRYFIDAIATHVAILDKHGITLHIGNYSEYVERLREEARFAVQEAEIAKTSQGTKPAPKTVSEAVTQTLPRTRLRSSDLRKAKSRVEQLETRIAEIEARQTGLAHEQNAAAVAQDVVALRALQSEAVDLDVEYAAVMIAWEESVELLETLEAQVEDKG